MTGPGIHSDGPPRMGALGLRVEGDVIVVKWHGDLDVEHVRRLLLCIESVATVHERVFLVVNAHGGRRIDPEARKLAIAWKLPRDLAGVCIFGASAPIRVLVNVMSKALRLVRGIMTPVQLVKTEAAAREWIDAERRTYQDA